MMACDGPTSPVASDMADEPKPSTSKEKTICAVCLVESDNHHIHYGALACFSCRAFFRRAHNKGSQSPTYQCKKEKKCDITSKNRKKCQRCRYEKCLKVGMNPKLVLTEDQKKVRFRKMIEKKGSLAFARKRTNTNPSSTEDESGDDDERKSSSRDTKQSREEAKNPFEIGLGMRQGYGSSSVLGSADSGVASLFGDELSKLMADNMDAATFASATGIIDENQIKQEILSEFNLGVPQDPSPFQIPLPPSGSQFPMFPPAPMGSSVQALRAMLDKKSEMLNTSQMNPYQYYQQPTFYPDLSQYPFPAQQQQQSQHYSGPSFSLPQQLANSNNTSEGSLSYSQISVIMRAHEYAANAMPLDKSIETNLVKFQFGDLDSLSKAEFQQVLNCCSEQFRVFAMQLDTFSSLPMSDQRDLLSHNAPIYVQYIMARYFAAQDGLEQLRWLLGKDSQDPMTSAISAMVKKVSIETFDRSLDVFQPGSDKTFYSSLAEQLTQLGLVQRHNPLVGAILLFSQTESMSLVSGIRVHQVNEALINFLSDANTADTIRIKRESLEKLMDVIHVVSDFPLCKPATKDSEAKIKSSGSGKEKTFPLVPCKKESLEGEEEEETLRPQHLAMSYTVEEEAWLKKQLGLFQSAYQEVALGDDLVNEFIMFSYDVPLSKHFIPSEISAFLERSRRILKMHPEFRGLSDSAQKDIYKENCHKAAALCSVKAESYLTGNEQLKFCFGEEDRSNWDRQMSPLVLSNSTKLKKVLLTDWNRTTNAMDTETLLNYLQLTGNLSTSVEDMETFKLIALIAMFSGQSASSQVALSKLEKKYTTILQRRAASEDRKNRVSYAKIRSGLETVDELATIFEKLQTS